MTALSTTYAARSRAQRLTAPLLTIGGLGVATLALHVRDPHSSGTWGYCPSAALGFWCPGCGGLRAVNDLSNGQVGAALSSNLVFTVLAPFIVLALAIWALDRWQGRERHVDAKKVVAGAWALGVVLVVFTVLRNLAIGSWLAP